MSELNIKKIVVCQVWNCKRNAQYMNPNNGFKYCLDCKRKLKGKIIHQTKPVLKYTKLVKIPKIPFNVEVL